LELFASANTQTNTEANTCAYLAGLTIIIPRMGGDLAPTLGGRKNFSPNKFSNEVFLGKSFHFIAHNF